MSAYHEAVRLGVKFIAGEPRGKVTSLLYSNNKNKVLGAKIVDGIEHTADFTILAAGASGDLIFDFEMQLRPTAWTLAHIPSIPDEVALFKDLPILYNPERGFFLEPDAEKHELKFCDEHPGYINMVHDADAGHDGKEQQSAPFARHQIPLESEERMRKFLRDIMPQIAERDFSFARICWDADTVDRQFLIDKHPKYEGLIVAAGGSGMGFMMMSVVGQLIVGTLEGVVEPELKRGLRWRPKQAANRDWQAVQDRFGGEGRIVDFHNVKGWTIGRGDKTPNTQM